MAGGPQGSFLVAPLRLKPSLRAVGWGGVLPYLGQFPQNETEGRGLATEKSLPIKDTHKISKANEDNFMSSRAIKRDLIKSRHGRRDLASTSFLYT